MNKKSENHEGKVALTISRLEISDQFLDEDRVAVIVIDQKIGYRISLAECVPDLPSAEALLGKATIAIGYASGLTKYSGPPINSSKFSGPSPIGILVLFSDGNSVGYDLEYFSGPWNTVGQNQLSLEQGQMLNDVINQALGNQEKTDQATSNPDKDKSGQDAPKAESLIQFCAVVGCLDGEAEYERAGRVMGKLYELARQYHLENEVADIILTAAGGVSFKATFKAADLFQKKLDESISYVSIQTCRFEDHRWCPEKSRVDE